MRIRFVSPPPEQRKGGIENAIEGLRAALHSVRVDVLDGGDPSDAHAIHHFHGLWNPRHAWLARHLRSVGRPYVVSPHGMLEPWAFRNRAWKKRPYFRWVERPFLRGASALFVTSGMEAAHLGERIDHPRVEVLPLGCRDPHGPDRATARRALGWGDARKTLLFLSRIDRKKGLDLLLRALAGLPEAQSWRLVVVGDGDPACTEELRGLARELARHLPAIEWAGGVWGERRWAYLQAADLFCLPTHSENFGIAVLEALHAGTPVLTTDQTPWVDHRGQSGVFIARPETDSLRETLGAALVRVAEGWPDADRAELSSWAEAHFGWPGLVQRYLEAYQRAIHVPPNQ